MTPAKIWAIAAMTWCVLFGLLSLAWAAGLDIGVGQLAESLQREAAAREPSFVTILVATGLAKIAGDLVPLITGYQAGPRPLQRIARLLCWIGGVTLSLYGIVDIVTGTWRAIEGTGSNAIWYAVLWGPIWLLGGILFLLTAWYARRDRRNPAFSLSPDPRS